MEGREEGGQRKVLSKYSRITTCFNQAESELRMKKNLDHDNRKIAMWNFDIKEQQGMLSPVRLDIKHDKTFQELAFQ